MSAAVGADNPAYRVRASNGGFAATSPAMGLSLHFGRSGVSVSSGATRVGLSLQAVGYGTSLSPLNPVAPRLQANRVVYARAGLSEWYVNGPLGLEQGFTIERTPTGHSSGPLTLAVALSGNVHASLGRDGLGVTLRHAGGSSLRYGGLWVQDARGRVLRGWLALRGGRLLLRVDTRGAQYPLRVDPFIQPGQKLTGAGESGQGELGSSVALSSDGNTALVGAPLDNSGAGAAWVFARSGSSWSQQGEKLTGAGESGPGEFGYSVALSADGNTAVIGGPGASERYGAAWVFTRSGSSWTQQGEKLTSSRGGRFGYAVALSSDGNTALIGAPFFSPSSGCTCGERHLRLGAVFVFARSGSTWAQQGEALTGAGTGDVEKSDFGGSVVLSADDTTAMVGAPYFPEGANEYTGAVYVFTRSGETWSEEAMVKGSGEGAYVPDESQFGHSVALSADGNTALVGGPFRDAAWVFTRSGSTWAQQGELTGVNWLGYSVALSSDGNTALIGEPLATPYGEEAEEFPVGAARLFTRSGGKWTEREQLTAGAQSVESDFGWSVALSSDGDTALAGGPLDGKSAGAAWLFAATSGPTVVTESASAVAATSATLNATVNPNGETVSDCHFEYGTSLSYGSNVPCTPPPGSGTNPRAVSASLTGLATNATYDFRVVATNAGGTSYGSEQTFTTQPVLPEFGKCIKVPSEEAGTRTVYHGGFTAATCLVASGTHTGKYEWEPGVLKATFKTKLTSGSVTLESAVKTSKVTCAGETSYGEYTGLRTVGDVVLALTGCKRSTEQCSSTSAKAEEIVSNALEGALGVDKLEATSAKNKLGLDLYPAGKSGPLMEFSCGSTTVSVQGSVIVPVTADKMALTQALKFKASKGKQTPESFEGAPKDILEESFNGAPFEQVGLTLTTTQTNEAPVEVNSVV